MDKNEYVQMVVKIIESVELKVENTSSKDIDVKVDLNLIKFDKNYTYEQ